MLLADSRSTLDAVFGDTSLDEEASTNGGVKVTPSTPCIHRSTSLLDPAQNRR
jgi:hypothetical protein